MSTKEQLQIQSQSQSPVEGSSPTVDHLRRKHPCVLCQQRKVKCDRNEPCANCAKAHVQCISSTMLPPKRRKKRFAEAELLARLRRYEDHLRRYGADIDAINTEEVVTLSIGSSKDSPAGPGHQHHNQTPLLPIQPRSDAIRSLAIRQSLKHVKNNLSQGFNEEFRDAEELLQASSDEEALETPIMKAYDAINPDGTDFFLSTPSSDSLFELHPSPVHVFRLWQYFLDNVSPLIKIFHAPTVQQRVLEASADLDNVPKDMEALMFGIYATAVTSLAEPECMSIFGEERQILLARYQNGCRQALSRAGLLRSSDMTILQAFVLYLISCLNFSIDPRAHFCLTGIAVRIAQRMGLNYDGTTYALPPFETEMRRRLWFQIVFLDSRVSELSGVGSSVLNYIWTTKAPLNVNDSDLFPDMKEPPMEAKGITEMVYVLQRCDLVNVLRGVREGKVGETLVEKDRAISALRAQLSERYSQFCDPSIPLHLLSSLMMRSAIAKLSMGPRAPYANASTLSSSEKDRLFTLSLQMMEAHNALLGASSLGRFLWHISTNFPFPAHVYLLVALRERTVGPLVDRAWKILNDHYEKRKMVGQLSPMNKPGNSALHAAVASLTMKAWGMRVRDMPGLEAPGFVVHLKSRLGMDEEPNTKREKKYSDNTSHPSTTAVLGKWDVGVLELNTSKPSEPDAMVIVPSVDQMAPYMWSSDQPAMQFDMPMGMNFDDQLMQDLTPDFGFMSSKGIFAYDAWSDYHPGDVGEASSDSKGLLRTLHGDDFGSPFR